VELSKINHEKDQLLVLQYVFGGTGNEFYHTKRMEEGMTFDTFFKKLKENIIPSTEDNRYGEDWYKISQVPNGRVDRITARVIPLEKIASRVGSTLSEHVMIQRILDDRHSKLRYAVEPHVTERSTPKWDEDKLAERKDAAVF
jgi:hypothetical protein